MTLTNLQQSIIDNDIFGQVQELDEMGDDQFSRSLVQTFIEETRTSIVEMETTLQMSGDLVLISKQAHCLKGSAASLGIVKLRSTFEQIQRTGEQRISGDDLARKRESVRSLLKQASFEFAEAVDIFTQMYDALL